MDYLKNVEENESSEITPVNIVNDWSNVACTLIKSLEHNTDSVLDISKEVSAIKTLAPDDIYRQMITQVFQDEKMTTQEKTDQALRILHQRMDDQKDSAQIVEELQSKKAENSENISDGQSNVLAGVFGGVLAAILLFTPGGRALMKSGFLAFAQASLK